MNIKIVHLLTQPTEKREVNSISSVSKLGIFYTQHINKIFEGEVPKSKWYDRNNKCEHHEEAAYGCYDSHKKAMATADGGYATDND